MVDPDRHRELTGAPLEPILANLRAIAGVGVPVWLRVPVMPGLTDGEDNLRAVARLAAEHPSVRRVSLLPYHGTGARKLARWLTALQHNPNRPEDVLKVDCDEEGVGGDDAADALRYLVGTKPREVVVRKLRGL